MVKHLKATVARLSWAQRFLLASLVILVAGMAGIGAWVGGQIESGVVHQTAATTALYVDSVVAPHLQNLASEREIGQEPVSRLDELFRSTPLGQEIVSFKVWDAQGRVLYSTNPASRGQVFPVEGGLARAWQGHVSAEISTLEAEENVIERARGQPLLEIYSPVRRTGANDIIAVAEFYQSVDELQGEIAAAVQRSWMVVGAVTLGMYLLLAGFVQRASNTITHQQAELSSQVVRLRHLLTKNAELDERVRRAAAQTTTSHEQFLRRISAELHDGPAQDVGLALLKLDNVVARSEAAPMDKQGMQDAADLAALKAALEHALYEIRGISAGMGVPQLNNLTLSEIVMRVVRTHERRTETHVAVHLQGLPSDASLPLKITLYRVIQEALTNAYRHGNGVEQCVLVQGGPDELTIQVSDKGPGANGSTASQEREHLGLVGMRERVESLGGTFEFASTPGHGATVTARLRLDAGQGNSIA
jgi:signal transduction histidine kinase